MFLTIFNAPNAPIGEVQILFGHQKFTAIDEFLGSSIV
jgi:hypothetical protein